MEQKIKNERIEIIDFLKGIAILLVIINHSIKLKGVGYSPFQIYQAVPVFLLIQVFHSKIAFERGKTSYAKYFSLKSITKILKRIIIPFAIVQLIWSIIFLIQGQIPWEVLEGGHGPGSYYIWIYLQFWLLIPLFIFFKNRLGVVKTFIIGFLLSVVEEILCCLFFDSLPMHISLYRVFAGRYLFLIPLGLLFFDFPIKLNFLKVFLSIISVAFINIDRFTDINMSPFFYESSWSGFHWLSYFYTVFVFMYLIQWLYKKLHEKIIKVINYLGRISYEIFLSQMLVLGLLINWESEVLILNVFIFIVKIALSIIPALIYNKIKDAKCINK